MLGGKLLRKNCYRSHLHYSCTVAVWTSVWIISNNQVGLFLKKHCFYRVTLKKVLFLCRENYTYMKAKFLSLVILVSLTACNMVQQKQSSAIDADLQAKADSILQDKLTEFGASTGQVIIMDVQTGEVKASAGNDSILQESGLVRMAALLAALETKSVSLSDTINVGNGVLIVGNDTLCDYNWRKGGYGRITLEQGFALSSDIALYKTIKKTFKNGQAFAEALGNLGYQVKDTSLVYNPLGYGILTTPLQNLTFITSVAIHNADMKQALEYTVIDGLGQPAKSEKVKVAGATGTLLLSNGEYAVEFCGYFPADNPKYSMIVTLNKDGQPASGGAMAGSVFREIAEYMMRK